MVQQVSEEVEDAGDEEEVLGEDADPGDGTDWSEQHSEGEAEQTGEQLVWPQRLELTILADGAESQHQWHWYPPQPHLEHQHLPVRRSG